MPFHPTEIDDEGAAIGFAFQRIAGFEKMIGYAVAWSDIVDQRIVVPFADLVRQGEM